MDKFTVEEINLMCVFGGAGQDGHDCRHKERNHPHTGQRYGGACRAGHWETGSHER